MPSFSLAASLNKHLNRRHGLPRIDVGIGDSARHVGQRIGDVGPDALPDLRELGPNHALQRASLPRRAGPKS